MFEKEKLLTRLCRRRCLEPAELLLATATAAILTGCPESRAWREQKVTPLPPREHLQSPAINSAQDLNPAVNTNNPPASEVSWALDRTGSLVILRKLDRDPECRDYIKKLMTKISANCMNCNEMVVPHDTMIYARFRLHQDGRISDITITGNTNEVVAPCCIKAIKNAASASKWPDEMRTRVGAESFIIYFDFGFNMTPPGPG